MSSWDVQAEDWETGLRADPLAADLFVVSWRDPALIFDAIPGLRYPRVPRTARAVWIFCAIARREDLVGRYKWAL